MSSRNRVPPLLEPYIRLPPGASLLLLTGVLNATPNWLVTRYISGVLSENVTESRKIADDELDGNGANGRTAVLLVSWLRDHDFWKSEARRGGGLDLARLTQQHRFAYIDGLTNLFPPSAETTSAETRSAKASSPSPIPVRQPTTLPQRGPPVSRPQPPTAPTLASTTQPSSTTSLTSSSLSHASEKITATISTLRQHNDNIFLILDSPTLLLATDPQITASDLSAFILNLRAEVHSTLLVLEADGPLVGAASPGSFDTYGLGAGTGMGVATPVESQHAAFSVGQAHNARMVMGVRGLDTGVARDVSGVLRAVRGGAWDEDDEQTGDMGRTAEVEKEMEVLYFVQADGGVKVFERGGGDVG